jgi:3-hydroxymyristoyl/3-hydroxydecanoyl-(acyl carrier protein) dehydratase
MIDVETCFKFEEMKFETAQQALEQVAGRDFVSAKWLVPHDLPYLQGHFPDQPIVPGVAILDATVQLISMAFGAASLNAVKNSKFLRPLLPGSTVLIECRRVINQEWTADWNVDTKKVTEQAAGKTDEGAIGGASELVARLLLVLV